MDGKLQINKFSSKTLLRAAIRVPSSTAVFRWIFGFRLGLMWYLRWALASLRQLFTYPSIIRKLVRSRDGEIWFVAKSHVGHKSLSVGLSVGMSVCRHNSMSVMISLKGGKFHFHAPFGAIVTIWNHSKNGGKRPLQNIVYVICPYVTRSSRWPPIGALVFQGQCSVNGGLVA